MPGYDEEIRANIEKMHANLALETSLTLDNMLWLGFDFCRRVHLAGLCEGKDEGDVTRRMMALLDRIADGATVIASRPTEDPSMPRSLQLYRGINKLVETDRSIAERIRLAYTRPDGE